MITIKKIDEDQQIVYGEVYAPVTIPDSDGDVMSAKTIEDMAHNFMKSYSQGSIDVNHDGKIVESTVVESFIARKGDDVYIDGAWVVGVHIANNEIWQLVKDGELNGFSLQGVSRAVMREIEIEIPEQVSGRTSKDDGHDHKFTVDFDDNGNFLGGRTDTVEGHSHPITRGTITQKVENHDHKFSFVEVFADG